MPPFHKRPLPYQSKGAAFISSGEIMPFTDAQKKYAYYVIATVESECDYGSVYQEDPITLGIAQWYGQHAWRLMNKMRSEAPNAYAKLSSRLRGLMDDPGKSTWDFWASIYTTNDDAASFRDSATLNECKRVQDELFLSDAFGGRNEIGDLNYYDTLINMHVENDPKKVIYWMCVYHQLPRWASRGISAIGGSSSIERIRDWLLSTQGPSQYRNRYQTTYDLLAKWDGVSDPPDFGMVGEVSSDPSGNIEQTTLQSQVSYVELVGNDLIIHGKVTSSEQLICHYNGTGRWLPKSGTNVDNPAGGSSATGDAPAASPDDPADFPAMRKLWYDNAEKWGYAQAPGRLNPPSSGFSDCSACIYWAANAATNNKYSWIGTSTRAMRENVHIVYETSGRTLPLSVLRPGDLIIMDYNGDNVTDHVEWYMGNGVVWGAGNAPLPHHTSDDVEHFLETFSSRLAHVWVGRFLD